MKTSKRRNNSKNEDFAELVKRKLEKEDIQVWKDTSQISAGTDMNGVKTDVVYSLNRPQLCHSCVETLTTIPKHKIEKEIIDKVQNELKKMKKGLYYQLSDFAKCRPIMTIVISSLFAIILGIIGSTIAALIWDKILK